MTRQIWFLLFAFLFVPAPSRARPQLKPSLVLASQAGAATADAATADAVKYVGGPATMRSGEDIGAQINAAYASLPANGGTIVVISPAGGQCYSFSTPIVAAVPGKYLLLAGGSLGASQVKRA